MEQPENVAAGSEEQGFSSNVTFASVWVKIEQDSDSEEEVNPEIEKEPCNEIIHENQSRKMRHKGPLLNCAMCDYSTWYRSSLVLHNMAKHNTVKAFACKQCPYTTKYPTALRRHNNLKHQQVDVGKVKSTPTDPTVFKCDQCDFTANFKWNLRAHKRKHLPVKQFKCLECPFETAYRHNFFNHTRQHSKMFYKCDKCTFVTKYEGHIYRHMSQIHKGLMNNGHDCQFCDFSTMVRWRLNIHVARSKQAEMIKCAHCDFQTMYKCQSKQHKKTHSAETSAYKKHDLNPINIQIPDSVMDLAKSLSEMSESKASGQPSEPTDTNYTDDHQKSNHYTIDPKYSGWNIIQVLESDDKDRPYKCFICNYTSKFKAAVQRHFQRQHTGKQSRPFKCSNCDFSTKTKDQISLHNKRSQSNDILQCTSCEFTTIFKCQLVMHRKTHYECKCKICNYSCKSKYDLEKHYSIQHLGDYVQCQYCEYRTARKDTMLSHEAIHTGEKPLKCPQCDYKTVRNSFLLKHIHKIHGTDEVTITDIKALRVPMEFFTNEGQKDEQQTLNK